MADGSWQIADAGLAEFYARVQTQLTSAQGGRVVVTSRYLPAGTRDDLANVCVVKGLNDFKDYEFLKLLKRDQRVGQRIRDGELPIKLLKDLYTFAGGTPRFLERLRTLLRTFPADELEAALSAGRGTLVKERDQYLEKHFGPKLFALLSTAAQKLLGRLGLSQLPLPVEALAALTGLDGAELDAAVKQAVEFGLLQVFEETELPALYLPPGVWRGWLAERLTGDERTAAHGVLAAFWRGVFENDREGEVRVGWIDGLRACRAHARDGDNRELRLWASVRLSRFWEQIGEWPAARAVLAEIPEAERDGAAWHTLASIDLNEGDYAAARDKFAKALAMRQETGDRPGEATAWHQLASIDLNEGDYAAARDKFAKSLRIKQQLGDRKGEATTWHQLATIDLEEGSYAAARDKFAKALGITQQIGNRRGEAATWHQLATIDLREGEYAAARDKLAKSLGIEQQIGNPRGEAETFAQLAYIEVEMKNHDDARRLYFKARDILQQIGDRYGEAATWHNLASIDLNEEAYAAARDKFAKALAMRQQIGDRPGEAATLYQLGLVAAGDNNLQAAAKLVAVGFLLFQAMGHGDIQQAGQTFLAICAKLNLTEDQVRALLKAVSESYRQDRGAALLKEAFPDWP